MIDSMVRKNVQTEFSHFSKNKRKIKTLKSFTSVMMCCCKYIKKIQWKIMLYLVVSFCTLVVLCQKVDFYDFELLVHIYTLYIEWNRIFSEQYYILVLTYNIWCIFFFRSTRWKRRKSTRHCNERDNAHIFIYYTAGMVKNMLSLLMKCNYFNKLNLSKKET